MKTPEQIISEISGIPEGICPVWDTNDSIVMAMKEFAKEVLRFADENAYEYGGTSVGGNSIIDSEQIIIDLKL